MLQTPVFARSVNYCDIVKQNYWNWRPHKMSPWRDFLPV